MNQIRYFLAQESSLFFTYLTTGLSIAFAFISLAVGKNVPDDLRATESQRIKERRESIKRYQKQKKRAVIISAVCAAVMLLVGLNSWDVKYWHPIEPVEVPDLRGASYEDAAEYLELSDLALKITNDERLSDWTGYIVGEQHPFPGETVLPGTKVEILMVYDDSADLNRTPADTEPDVFLPPIPQFSIYISADPEYSDAAISPSCAFPGDEVLLNVRTSDYSFDLKLIDRDGNELAYEREDWGFFNFIMPNSAVAVCLTSPQYIPDEPVTPGVPSEPAPSNPVCGYGPVNCPTLSFTDLDPNAWYHNAVDFVVANGILSGCEERFLPDGTLTRAEVSMLFYRMAEALPIVIDYGFTDVPDTAWYAAAVNWAAGQGVIGGYGDNTFRPNDPVTMEQFITILWRYAGSPADVYPYLAFSDASEISQYAADAVEWAAGQRLLLFTNGILNPQNHISRVEAAEILKNYIGT